MAKISLNLGMKTDIHIQETQSSQLDEPKVTPSKALYN